MIKRIAFLLSIFTIILAGIAGAGIRNVQAQDPTIPTRTPTPDPSQPTRSNPTATSGSDNPVNPPPPSPTDTPVPAAATTSTGTITAPEPGPAGGSPTPTPLGIAPSAVGAAADCDDTPYARAIKHLTIYAGPGGDYERIGTLEIDETRLILGRAGYADWWQIQISPDTIGWVDNEDVNVAGDTARVLIAEPPAINGATPTPGVPWNPTPLPLQNCAPTPSPTPTDIPTATPLSGSGAENSGSAAGQSGSATPGMVLAEVESATAAPEVDETTPGLGVSSRGSEASRAASPTSATNLVLPLAGLALIAGGIALALLSRNRGGEKTDEPKTIDPK